MSECACVGGCLSEFVCLSVRVCHITEQSGKGMAAACRKI